VKPLAITGFGVLSAAGVDEFSLKAPSEKSYFSKTCSLYDTAPYANTLVAEIPNFDASKYIGDKGLRNNDRLTRILIVATRIALQRASVKADGKWLNYGPDDVGVVAATAYGSLEAIHELNVVARTEDPRYLNPARFPNTVINSSLGYVSIWEDLRALNATVVNGPCGALDAVGCAELYFATHRARCLVVGGAEALSEGLHLATARAGLIRENDATSALGEAACMFVVEPLEAARKRTADVLATIVGYGTAFESPEDLSHLVAPSQSAMQRAIRGALKDASVDAADIDVVVNDEGSNSVVWDPERDALRAVLGDTQRRSLSMKQWLGETLGASGALGIAGGVEALREGARWVLVVSMGFYGNASAVVLRRAE
jgi:3-oxoacyl-[acyl-carrier-protein] synthase II